MSKRNVEKIKRQLLEAKGIDLKDSSDEDVVNVAKGLGFRIAELSEYTTKASGKTGVYLKTPDVNVRGRGVKGLFFRLGEPGGDMDVDAARKAIKIMRNDLDSAELVLRDLEEM